MKAGLYSLTLADAPRRLIWAFPRGKILPRKGGPTWDLDADLTDVETLRFRWDDVVDSIGKWLAVFQPPIIVDHGRSESGIPVAHGLVTGLVEVGAQMAEAYGVPQIGDAVYLACEPSAELGDLLDSGAVPYVSPNLQAAYTDDEGVFWPLVVKELSLTLDPRQKKRQLPIAQTAALSAALLSEVEDMPEATEGMDIGEAVKALAELVATVVARLDKLEASMMDGDGEAVEAAAEDTAAAELSEPSEIVALRKRVAELENAAKLAASTAAVEALLSERDLAADARLPLVKLHMVDPAAAAAIARSAPKRGTALKRAPVTGPASVAALSDMSREEMAAHLVQTGAAKSLTEAWNSLQQ